MEYEIKIIDNKGVIVASTYISASSKEDLIASIRDVVDSAESGEMDWLDEAIEE